MASTAIRPLQREIRLLIRALVLFLIALIVALFALALTLVRMNRLAATADAIADALRPTAAHAGRADLRARLDLLPRENGIARIEVYRGEELYVASGNILPSAEVLTRPLPGGRLLLYFDVSSWVGGRRTAVAVGAFATLATITGLLLLMLYVPKFVRPLEEMLEQAQQLGVRQRGDDDARYLVHTFREAVERIQQQDRELENLREAASSRAPDMRILAGAMDRSTSGFLAVDAEGHIVSLNDAARTILGVAPESEKANVGFAELPATFRDLLTASLQARMASSRREIPLDSSGVVIGVTTVPLFEADLFLGLFVLFTDLRAFRAMEERLRDFENLVSLGQMSAGIAHEFRNSLFAITGYLHLAQRTATEDAAAKIRSAEDEAKRLAAAVDALLNFARPLTLRSQVVRLDELTEDVIERVRAEAPGVTIDLSAQPVELQGDRELLERALENVVRNAVDAVLQRHSDGGGRIDVVVENRAQPRIVIHDNGIGIAGEDAARLLLPFQSSKSHGFGLGLPLARKIVLHHGGTLAFNGEVGGGATVTMDFFRPPSGS